MPRVRDNRTEGKGLRQLHFRHAHLISASRDSNLKREISNLKREIPISSERFQSQARDSSLKREIPISSKRFQSQARDSKLSSEIPNSRKIPNSRARFQPTHTHPQPRPRPNPPPLAHLRRQASRTAAARHLSTAAPPPSSPPARGEPLSLPVRLKRRFSES